MRTLIRIAILAVFCDLLMWADGSAQAVHPPFVKTWEYDAHELDQFESFQVVEDTIYYGSFDHYGALNLATGKVLWEKAIPEKAFGVEIACDGKTLYVAIGENNLIACQAQTGESLWSLPREGYSGPILLLGDILYCELNIGTLTALEAGTHKPLWNFDLGTPTRSKERFNEFGLANTLAASGGRLFIGTRTGEVICLNSKTGKIIWRYGPIADEKEPSVPGLAVDSGHVYFGTTGGTLGALSITTGKRVWQTSNPGRSLIGPFLLHENVIVAGEYHRGLSIYGRSDGLRRWEVQFDVLDVSISPPVVFCGQILSTNGTKIIAFDTSGNQLWIWDTEEILSDHPIIPLSDGFLLSGKSELYRLQMGEPPAFPTKPQARKEMAVALVSRFDKLLIGEKRKLPKLGDDAFEPLLNLVQEQVKDLDKFSPVDDYHWPDEMSKIYDKFFDACEILSQVATEKRTKEMLSLYESAKLHSTKEKVLGWLARSGDSSATISLFLDIIKNTESLKIDGYTSRNIALDAIAKSHDSKVISYLMEQLNNPLAPADIRQVAFQNLPKNAGEAGVKAVLAAKDTNKEIGSISKFMRLADMPAAGYKESDKIRSIWPDHGMLLDTCKDSFGTTWGLISSCAVGSLVDLWVAQYDDKTWGQPIFIGLQTKKINETNWRKKIEKIKKMAVDSDSDGWSDLVEKRLGTDPKNPDTDGDGLKDSIDKNPLAAPRTLNEDEQVIRAAFQARFQFHGERPAVLFVYLPKGMKPFELYGADWVTISQEERELPRPRDEKFESIGKGIIFFAPLNYDVDGNKIPDGKAKQIIRWNRNHTEAEVQLCTRFGGLDGTGYDIHLKRFGNDWVVIDIEMAWIS
jgi:outer membrane protein assembly factor BamB